MYAEFKSGAAPVDSRSAQVSFSSAGKICPTSRHTVRILIQKDAQSGPSNDDGYAKTDIFAQRAAIQVQQHVRQHEAIDQCSAYRSNDSRPRLENDHPPPLAKHIWCTAGLLIQVLRDILWSSS